MTLVRRTSWGGTDTRVIDVTIMQAYYWGYSAGISAMAERVTTIDLLHALQKIDKRAERGYDDSRVIDTYVEAGALADALANHENGIISGRRGTGKTHALKYLGEKEKSDSNLVIHIDMAMDLGSTDGIYADPALPLSERASRLLVDVLGKIHDTLLDEAFEERGEIEPLEKMMDHFGKVVVAEHAEREVTTTTTSGSSITGQLSADIKAAIPSVGAALGGSSSTSIGSSSQSKASGHVRTSVRFGEVTEYMQRAITAHPANRVWLLFDEWSNLPMDVQPYLAEMLRRLFFALPKVTVRIAAIPHRTQWRIKRSAEAGYIGVEIGAELFPNLDLDEFVVFPARNRREQTDKSTDFFRNLLHRHLNQRLRESGKAEVGTPEETVSLLFTQITALHELVKAAEGVPRDALIIVGRAAIRAGDVKISSEDVRAAAAQVYQTTKAAQLNAAPKVQQLLDVIVQDVISKKKARAFLLAQEHSNNELIRQLLDDRILHVIKRGYSSKDDPGVRFDVIQIDYGCYVQLLATKSAPQGLFGVDVEDDNVALGALYGDIEVHTDDYRAIRRAVLNLPQKLIELDG